MKALEAQASPDPAAPARSGPHCHWRDFLTERSLDQADFQVLVLARLESRDDSVWLEH